MAMTGYKDIPFNVNIHLATQIGPDALENVTFNVKREEGVTGQIELGATSQSFTGANWATNQSLLITGRQEGRWFIEYECAVNFTDDIIHGQFAVTIAPLTEPFVAGSVAGVFDPTTSSYFNGSLMAGKPSIGTGDPGFVVSIGGGAGCYLEIHAPDGTISHASAGGGGGSTIVNCASQVGTWFAYVHTQVKLLPKNVPFSYDFGPIPTVDCKIYDVGTLPVNPINLKGTVTGKLNPAIYWNEVNTQHIGPGPYPGPGTVYVCGDIPGAIIDATLSGYTLGTPVVTGGFAAGVTGVTGTGICFTAPGGYVTGRRPISIGGVVIGQMTGLVNAAV